MGWADAGDDGRGGAPGQGSRRMKPPVPSGARPAYPSQARFAELLTLRTLAMSTQAEYQRYVRKLASQPAQAPARASARIGRGNGIARPRCADLLRSLPSAAEPQPTPRPRHF